MCKSKEINPTSNEAIEAVKAIEKFFNTDISYQALAEEMYDATVKVLEDYQDIDRWDGDKRPYQLAYNGKQMLDLLRPFAVMMGQAERVNF